MLLSTRLSMLHNKEEELQDEVRALNGRLSRLDGDSNEASHLHLEQKISQCNSELVNRSSWLLYCSLLLFLINHREKFAER